mmetsp:Transcript_13995/g.30714  ORF Transcript_13995/g.30714 Transcript_13995/m.30714 type:complete len:201 (+) Transcript_13995:314-916(+)
MVFSSPTASCGGSGDAASCMLTSPDVSAAGLLSPVLSACPSPAAAVAASLSPADSEFSLAILSCLTFSSSILICNAIASSGSRLGSIPPYSAKSSPLPAPLSAAALGAPIPMPPMSASPPCTAGELSNISLGNEPARMVTSFPSFDHCLLLHIRQRTSDKDNNALLTILISPMFQCKRGSLHACRNIYATGQIPLTTNGS